MKSIRWRLVILYVMLVMIVMIVSGTIIITYVRNDAYDKVYDDLVNTAKSITTPTEMSDSNNKEELLNNLIETIQRLEKNLHEKQICVINNSNRIEYQNHTKQYSIGELTSRTIIAAKEGRILRDLYSGNYAEPIIFNDKVCYVLFIHTSLDAVKETLSHTIVIIIIAVLVAITLSGLLGFVFANSITKPILTLSAKAKQIAVGKLNENTYSIEVQSDDEIGELTKSFNYMAKELNKTLSLISSEKNKLQTVFTHMADGILVFDKNGIIIHSNPVAYEMLGAHLEKSNNFSSVFEQLENKVDFEKLLKLDKNAIMSYLLNTGDKFINACFATYLDKTNNTVGLITVLQDMTEQKKLEQMQKDFVANVSHELRTPIATIKMYTETLLDGAIEQKEIANNFLNVINSESDRMTALVEDLLELSRLDNKQIKFNVKPLDLTDFVEQSIEKYKILAKQKKQKITYYRPDEHYEIDGDANRIEQVIKNIVTNAVKYSPEDTMIDVKLESIDDILLLSIKDNGIGIPEEDIPKIFNRFHRVEKARSRAMGGTGLGLAIAKEIMECHNGKISVDSKINKGTTFYLQFPKKIC